MPEGGAHHEAGEKSTTEATRRDREPKITEAKQRDRTGGTAAHEECGSCSSLRVRGVELTMKFHGVEFQSLGG